MIYKNETRPLIYAYEMRLIRFRSRFPSILRITLKMFSSARLGRRVCACARGAARVGVGGARVCERAFSRVSVFS